MKITIEVSENNEGTSFPWWVIVDPDAFEDVQVPASKITGPFFSREEAEAELAATRYNYSKRAVVYCNTGYYSRQYKQKINETGKSWFTKLKEVFNANR